MDKTKKEQAEKLQIKLDKLLQTREKKQAAFDKAKKEVTDLNKNIDSTKLKLFEILQSGSDDTAFSNWAKRKISENEKTEIGKTENPKTANHENANSAKSTNAEKPTSQNQSSQTSQNHQQGKEQNQSQPQQQNPIQRQ